MSQAMVDTTGDSEPTPIGRAELRVEAKNFEWKDLGEAQKAAGSQAVSFVQTAARQPWRMSEPLFAPGLEFLPIISDSRRSGVLLLDGARGTGKTSLLLTLIHHWSLAICDKDMRSKNEKRTDPFDCNLPIVPVGLLDLRQLRDASMMLQLTLTLKTVVQSLQPVVPQQTSLPPAPWSPHTTTELPSLTKWREFFSTVAVGWDNNLGQRAASLDAETYSAELEQSAMEAHTVSAAFASFVDALANDFMTIRLGNRAVPLFVICIDDADMNPHRSMELLELLSMLSHPRLVFLMTGDSGLFKAALRQHYAKLLTPGGAQPDAPEFSHQAVRLANQFYAKVIPRQQRCGVESLKPLERIERLYMFITDGNVDPFCKKLATKVKRLFEEQPSTAHSLPGQFRELMDVATWLARPAPASDDADIDQRLAELAERLWRDANEEEQDPWGHASRSVVTLTQPVRSRFRVLPLALQPGLAPKAERQQQVIDVVKPAHLPATPDSQYELKFQIQTRTIVQASPSGPSYADAERLLGAWEFACNVKGEEQGTATTPGTRIDHKLVGLEKRRGSEAEFFSWPFPNWTKASTTAGLHESWSTNLLRMQRQLSAEDSEDERVAAYLSVYFYSVLSHLDKGRNREGATNAFREPPKKPEWDTIAKAVVELWQPPAEHDASHVAHAWARQAAPLVFSPALGVPISIVRTALGAFSDAHKDWKNVFSKAYEHRENRKQTAELDALAREAQHPWFDLVNGTARKPRSFKRKRPSQKMSRTT